MSNKIFVKKCNKFKNNQYMISEDPPSWEPGDNPLVWVPSVGGPPVR